MAAIFQIRRGTSDISSSITDGELYLHKGKGSLQFGSGSGNPITLLPLNVPVVGDINLSGSISASGDIRLGGNIYLGDTIGNDSVNVNSAFSGSIIPSGSNVFDLGSTTFQYRNVHATAISGAIAATNGVISGSSQIVSILVPLNNFSGSVLTQLTEIGVVSGSLILSASTAKTTNDTQDGRLTNLESKSGSVDTRLIEIGIVSGSLISSASTAKTSNDSQDISITNINTFSGSVLTRLTEIGVVSGSLISSASSVSTRLTEIGVVSGSLISSASNTAGRLTNIEVFSSSFDTAFNLIGTNVTITGNLTVQGTTTQVDSTTVQIGDNIIELNGTGTTNGGLLVKDPTAPNTISGSLLWDSTNDYWKAGALSSESKLLRADGDSVVSGSSQIIGILDSLNTFSGSVLTRLTEIGVVSGSLILSASTAKTTNDTQDISITNLNTFSGSQLEKDGTLATYTGSVDTRLIEIGVVSGSLISSASAAVVANTNLNTFSGSVLMRLTEVGVVSGSLILSASTAKTTNDSQDVSITNLNTFSGSQLTQNIALATISGSLILSASAASVSITNLNSTTASLNISVTNLNTFSASYYTDSGSFDTRINALDPGNIAASLIAINQTTASLNLFSASVTSSLEKLNETTASLNTFTSSTTTRLNNLESTSASLLISVINLNSTTASLNTSVSNLNLFTSSVATGSLVTSITNLNSFTSSINTTIKTRLNTEGVISGSSQIDVVSTTGDIVLGTRTSGNYVEVISGSANQITVAGSGLESAVVTLSLPQNIHTSADIQFKSLGIGTAASTVTGEIRATGDIVAFYSSDERLKSNIQPIVDALDKVNQISGNVYDWKKGFEDIHSHTGTDIGVIAQEIEKVLPQAVTDRDSGYKAVNYEKIVPLLIEAIKELSNKIDKLENK